MAVDRESNRSVRCVAGRVGMTGLRRAKPPHPLPFERGQGSQPYRRQPVHRLHTRDGSGLSWTQASRSRVLVFSDETGSLREWLNFTVACSTATKSGRALVSHARHRTGVPLRNARGGVPHLDARAGKAPISTWAGATSSSTKVSSNLRSCGTPGQTALPRRIRSSAMSSSMPIASMPSYRCSPARRSVWVMPSGSGFHVRVPHSTIGHRFPCLMMPRPRHPMSSTS